MKKSKANLRTLINSGKTLCFPGAFNAAVALQIQQAGFPGVYVSGAGISNGLAGLPDIELVTRKEMIWANQFITSRVEIPVFSDADTGYGGPLQVAKTVEQFESIGVSAIHLEDQKTPKRCGHLEGKKLISPEAMCRKIRVAVKARKSRNFLIVARTDSRGVEGFEACLTRIKAYIKAGADAIFPEALHSIEEFKQVRKLFQIPLVANMTEFGKTPYISIRQFQKLEYNIVLFPLSIFRLTMGRSQVFLKDLAKKGTQVDYLQKMQTREELYDLLQYSDYQ